jgi:hypothetical protein
MDITRENLFVKINKYFSEAQFRIQYFINTPESGTQIPLLFYAEKYKRDFTVRVDGKEVEIKKIDAFIKQTKHTKFHKFNTYFYESDHDHEEYISIFWSEHVGNPCKLSDLKYFEINLSKGAHLIEVNYTASCYTMIDDRDFFVYSLSPAEHWKSFNQLFVEIDNTAFGKAINSNLGEPHSGKLDSIATWEFDQLPDKFIEVSHAFKQKTSEQDGPQENSSRSSYYLILTISFFICLTLLYFAVRITRRG